jgi:hypothetical protein
VEAKDDFQRFLHGELVDFVRWITCEDVPSDTKFSNATVHGFDQAHPFLNPVFKTVVHSDLMLLRQPPQTGEGAIFFELFALTRDCGAV